MSLITLKMTRTQPLSLRGRGTGLSAMTGI
jgi:hypothetical protein